MARNGKKASDYLASRNRLIEILQNIDSEIDKTLKFRKSQAAADRAKVLFDSRSKVAKALLAYGIEIDPHKAVDRMGKEFGN